MKLEGIKDRMHPWKCQQLGSKLKSPEQTPKRNYQKGAKSPLEPSVQKVKEGMNFKRGRIANNKQLRSQLR